MRGRSQQTSLCCHARDSEIQHTQHEAVFRTIARSRMSGCDWPTRSGSRAICAGHDRRRCGIEDFTGKPVLRIATSHGVFNRLQVPPTNVTRGDMPHTFHRLRYWTSTKSSESVPGLSTAPPCKLSNIFCSVTEATSPGYMSSIGQYQVLVKLLTTLVASWVDSFCHFYRRIQDCGGRTHFSSVLTNGIMWRFYTAYDGGDKLRTYHIRDFNIRHDSGTIVELLKEMQYENLSDSTLAAEDVTRA